MQEHLHRSRGMQHPAGGPDGAHPADMSLLLRAHSEQRWLTNHLRPALEEVERAGAVPDEQIGAALAYLEVLWIDARRRARDTEHALAQLALGTERGAGLQRSARRYHAAVVMLRGELGGRVDRLTRAPELPAAGHGDDD